MDSFINGLSDIFQNTESMFTPNNSNVDQSGMFNWGGILGNNTPVEDFNFNFDSFMQPNFSLGNLFNGFNSNSQQPTAPSVKTYHPLYNYNNSPYNIF